MNRSDVKRFMNVGPGRGTEYYLPGPGAAAGLLDTQEIFDTESQMLHTPSPPT